MLPVLFVVVLLLFSRVVLADPITNPTHFDDTYWTWPSTPGGFTEMDTDITPVTDGSPDGYYFSAYYWFTGDYSATGGYLGLQTEGNNPTGKIVIFSIWGATSSYGPGYNTSGNEGGVYYTSRITYPWVINHTYDLRLSLMNQASGNNTWTATVTDQTTNIQSLVGNIVVPSSRGNLYDVSGTFHERYSGATASCSDLLESEVEFTNLAADNGAVSPSSHSNVGPSNSACSNYFATQDIQGGVESIIGGQFPVATPPAQTPTNVTTQPTTAPSKTPANTTSPIVSTTPTTTTQNTTQTPVPIELNLTTKSPASNKSSGSNRDLIYGFAIFISIILVIGSIGYLIKRKISKKYSIKPSVDPTQQPQQPNEAVRVMSNPLFTAKIDEPITKLSPTDNIITPDQYPKEDPTQRKN